MVAIVDHSSRIPDRDTQPLLLHLKVVTENENYRIPDWPLGIFLRTFISLILINETEQISAEKARGSHKTAGIMSRFGMGKLTNIAPMGNNHFFDEDKHKHSMPVEAPDLFIACLKALVQHQDGGEEAYLNTLYELIDQHLGLEARQDHVESLGYQEVVGLACDIMQQYVDGRPMFKMPLSQAAREDDDVLREEACKHFLEEFSTANQYLNNGQQMEIPITVSTAAYLAKSRMGGVYTEQSRIVMRPFSPAEVEIFIFGKDANTEVFNSLQPESQDIFNYYEAQFYIQGNTVSAWNPESGYDPGKLRGVNGGFKVDDPLLMDLLAVSIDEHPKPVSTQENPNRGGWYEGEFGEAWQRARALAAGYSRQMPFLLAFLLAKSMDVPQAVLFGEDEEADSIAVFEDQMTKDLANVAVDIGMTPDVGEWFRVVFSETDHINMQWFLNLVELFNEKAVQDDSQDDQQTALTA